MLVGVHSLPDRDGQKPELTRRLQKRLRADILGDRSAFAQGWPVSLKRDTDSRDSMVLECLEAACCIAVFLDLVLEGN